MKRSGKIWAILAFVITVVLFPSMPHAQYWFQSGAQGGSSSLSNQGASAMIQTITPQNVTEGSLAYWVGETLSNGAFIQVGYEVPNQSGSLPEYCNPVGCTGSVYINAGEPVPFWEYFLAKNSGSTFYGGVGGDQELGLNGSYNTYSFNSTGNIWSVYLNGQELGSINLGAYSSGQNPLLAIGELAYTNTNSYKMPIVMFRNIRFYNGTSYKLLGSATSTVGYGKGSGTALSNPFGVKEIGALVNYFEVGSGLPTLNGALLWQTGYQLSLSSIYGNITSTENYSAFSSAHILAPQYVSIAPGERALFVGWRGLGSGSYTGNSPAATVLMNQNITETAQWAIQYYINATSDYGEVYGAGWHNQSSETNISISSNIVTVATGERAIFSDWSNGARNASLILIVNSPANLTANWAIQYLVNGTSPYGSVIGNGWYGANSTATLTLTKTITNATQRSRIAFENWSNGNSSTTIKMKVISPISLSADFAMQYLVSLVATDAYNHQIGAQYFYVNENNIGSSFFAYPNKVYRVNSAYYKGVNVTSGSSVRNVTAPETFRVPLPVFNITIGAYGAFNIPLNTTLNITFKNGTQVSTYTGSSGAREFADVPYGYAYGYEEYFGEKQTVTLYNGGGVAPTFLTPTIIIVTFLTILLIIAVERLFFYEIEKPLRKKKRGRNKKRI